MKMNMIRVKRSEVEQIVNATFPEYRGRKIKIDASGSVTFTDLNWSGGTRSQYRACSLAGDKSGNMDPYNNAAPWANPAEGGIVSIPVGHCVVEHSICCGRDIGLIVHVHPQDMPKHLQEA